MGIVSVDLNNINLQSLTKYLRQTLVFMWNSALREKLFFSCVGTKATPPPPPPVAKFFFFSCVGTKAPPSAKMPWGYLSRKKDTVFCKKVVKVKI